MSPKRPLQIQLLAVSLGSGHLRAAEAIAHALRVMAPDCQVEILDIKPLVSPLFRFIQFHGYEFLIEHVPWVWGSLYRTPLFKNKKYAAPKSLLQHGNKALVERIRAFGPDVLISTQINCHELAYFISRRLPKRPRRISIVTDYDIHPMWARTPADLLVVAHPIFAEKLVNLGVPRASIDQLGIPIDLSFQEPHDRHAICGRFDLDPGIPILLVMGGSVGFGELDCVVDELLRSENPFQVLVVAGRNEKVHLRLERIEKLWNAIHSRRERTGSMKVKVFGFVDFIPELMTVADCFITKPGGLAATEALAKSLPMVFVNPIPGHEEGNAAFLVQQGAAVSVKKISELRPVLNTLFERDRQKLLEMQSAARGLAKPDAALNLAEHILQIRP
jgi:processive 1,2-diacylglycerol beta-glucosyltransferase